MISGSFMPRGLLTPRPLRLRIVCRPRRKRRGRYRSIDERPLFTAPTGRPVDATWAIKCFHRALNLAGLPVVRIHDLRHTAATYLLRRGVHPKVVQELLGHSTISLTLDTYSHVAPALHAEVADHMEVLFRDRLGGAIVADAP